MSSPSPHSPVPPRLAAAVVLARDRADGGIEVFMVRRHVRSEFAPDVFVFPGGSVKPGDHEAEITPGLCAAAGEGATALGSGLRVAALRELFEEAGVLLAYRRNAPLLVEVEARGRFADYRADLSAGRATLGSIAAREGLRLATDTLLYWAHWITPEAFPIRFDTHFFLAGAPAGQVAAHDDLEVTDSAWVTPEQALARHARGDFPLVFATIHQLRELAGLAGMAAAHAHYAGRAPATIMPEAVAAEGGGFLVRLPGDPGDPVRV
jgi:8-oxo-dGTP pyrophosphatase MutT (NUDIX family)